MTRQRIIDAQPIGALYKRASHIDKVVEHESENLRHIQFVLYWEPIPTGRTVHFWATGTTDSGASVLQPIAPPKTLDVTVIGCMSGRRGNGKRFRVDVIHATGLGNVLKNKDLNALIDIIKNRVQEEFPEQRIIGITKDIFVLEEKARWDS